MGRIQLLNNDLVSVFYEISFLAHIFKVETECHSKIHYNINSDYTELIKNESEKRIGDNENEKKISR